MELTIFSILAIVVIGLLLYVASMGKKTRCDKGKKKCRKVKPFPTKGDEEPNEAKKIEEFDFQCVTNIVFGEGKVAKDLGKLLKKAGAQRILLTYGRTAIKKMGLYDEVVKVLKDEKLDFWELNGIRPNPEVGKAREGIKIVREHKIDFILAVGGGSVIDLSKCISLGHDYDGDVWDIIYYGWRKNPEKKIKVEKFLKLGIILTLPASGSEMNGGCVISNDKDGRKLAMVYRENIPTFSILDPTYTYSVSPYQTRAGCFDIISHLLEQYFSSNDPYVPQRMTEALVKVVMKYLPIALKDPKSYEARSNIMWSSSLALNGLCASGRNWMADWSNHSMEHEASAFYPKLTHGIGLAICTMGWMRYVVEKRHDRFIDLGKNVFGMSDLENTYEDALRVIDYFEGWLVKQGFPVYFHDEESTKSWSHEDSKNAAHQRFEHFGEEMGKFIVLKEEDMVKILDSRMKRE